MAEIAERLALLIEAKTGGAVTELRKTTKSAEELALSQDRATLASAKMAAAQDKLAASLAKQQLAEAKAAGGAEEIAAAQTASAVAVERASVSKAQAAVAADRLAVSEMQAAEATAALGTTATGTAGLLERLGLAGTSASTMMATLGPLLGLAALGFGIKVLKDGIEHFQKLSGQIRALKSVTGGTAESVSLLVGEMKQLGVDPDAAAKAFARFGATIGDGSSKLRDYGIEVARNRDGTTDLLGTFNNLRTAYQGTTDAAERDAIAKQLGLRQMTAMLPLLKLTKEQMQELNRATRSSGGILTDEDLQHGRDLKVATLQMKDAFENLEIGLAKGFVPALAEALGFVTRIVEGLNNVKIPGGRGGGGDKSVIDTIGGLVGDLPNMLLFHQGPVADGHKDAGKAAAEQKAKEDELTETLKRNRDAQDSLTSALMGQVSAQRAVRDAAEGLEDAYLNQVDAQDRLNQLLKDGAVDEKAVASAKRDVASASRSVRNALEAEQDAQQALNKARERATALDLADANNKVALAGDRITSAQAAEQQSQEKLDALLGSGTATAGQIAAAQAEVKQRHDEVTQAIVDQARAGEDLQKTQQKGTDQDPAVIAAQRRVRDAHEEVSTAIQNQQDAMERLHTAEAGDPEYAKKVADARRDLARAHQNVADAQDNQITAALGLQTAQDKLNGALGTTGDNLQTIIDKFTWLRGFGLDPSVVLGLLGLPANYGVTHNTGGSVTSGNPQPRAKGGRMEPYQSYLVAEPGTGGEIIHMGSTGGFAMPAGRGGVVIHNTTNVTTNASAHDIARENAWSLRTTVVPRIHEAA